MRVIAALLQPKVAYGDWLLQNVSQDMSTTSTVAIPERTTNNHTSLMAVLFIGFILSGIATTIIGPMLPVFIRKWNLDDGQAGLFSSIQFLASLVGTVVSGAWTAWRGYRPSLVAGYAFMGYGLATLNASTHANALAATAAFGLGYGLITPGTNLCVAETGGPRSLFRARPVPRVPSGQNEYAPGCHKDDRCGRGCRNGRRNRR